jgi:hypothetical protein
MVAISSAKGGHILYCRRSSASAEAGAPGWAAKAMTELFEFLIEVPGPRPPFGVLAEHLWGRGVDFDSDGDSVNAEDPNWTELTITRRPDIERVDIELVSQMPLVLKVASESRELALRAATFLAATTMGRLLCGASDQ